MNASLRYKVNASFTDDSEFTLGNPFNVSIPKGTRLDKDLRSSIEILSYDVNLLSTTGAEIFYIPTILKTYKFMGMDIDDSLHAVIKSTSGSFICGNIFDVEAYSKIIDKYRNNWDYNTLQALDKKLLSINIDYVKRLITGIKEGWLYDIYKRVGTESDSFISEYMSNQMKSGLNSEYKSVILTLIRNTGDSRDTSSSFDIDAIMIGVIISHIRGIIKRYNNSYSKLCAMDLFIKYESKLSGEDITRNRLSNALEIIDNVTGEVVDLPISFSGISKNESLYDSNTIREHCSILCENLSQMCMFDNYSSMYGTKDIIEYSMPGLHDTDGIDDVFSMSPEESQALSIIDGLNCVDEDAILCKETYNMDDPEDRGLFVKSVIRSYERNFNEFKPSVNYDVTEALAEMVDKGDLIGNKGNEVSLDQVSPEDDNSNVVVTSTEKEIQVSNMKDSLLRVSKLINKCSDKILKGFE